MIEKNEQLCCFNNKKEELEYYKSKYESFFKELVKYQLKVKSLENSNNKLREKVSNYLNINSTKNNNNNSEANFLSPLEFKKLWEYIIKTELIETFDFCINEYILIANLCQDIMLVVYEECKKNINNKFIEVLNCLNLGKISKDKREEIFNHFLPFFRENFNKIFIFSDNFLSTINSKLLSIIVEYNYINDIINGNNINNDNSNKENNNCDNNFYLNKIEEKIKQNNFDNIIKSFYKICIYMILHEPILNFDLEKYSQRKLKYFYYFKNDFINVDGFIKDNSPCIILLSPPLLKNKFNFHNLRAPVYIIHNPNDNIINECEKNKENILEKKNDDKIKSDRSIKSENKKDEYLNNNKRNKTFEEKSSINSINKKSPNNTNNKVLNHINNKNFNYIKSSQNIGKANGVYNINDGNDRNINNNIKNEKKSEYISKKKYDFGIKINNNNNSTKINDLHSNSYDNKILYIVSQPNNSKKNLNNQNPSDIAKKYINNIDKIKSNNNLYQKNNNYPYFLSSSTGNIGVGVKEKNENNNENNKENNSKNIKINNLKMEQNIYDVIMGNINKLKDTKLKEYYINNKNKNVIRNKNSKYCIKNHIYSNIKNMPNTTNNRIISKKSNIIHNNSQHYDLYLDKKISPSPSNLFKSYETNNDSQEINNIPSPKNEKYKNYNSFTHLLKLSNMNSILPAKTPIISSQNIVYNNLVLKGIKNNFENNHNKKIIQNSSNNINYKINFNNISNNNSIHSSNVTKNNFNPLSNRKKYISYIKNKNNENKSEIKERCSLNNYLKRDNKNKIQKKNNSNISNKQISNNNIRNSIATNNINNSKKSKKLYKQIIKNSLMIISEGNNNNINQKFDFNNCKKLNNNEIRNKNLNVYKNRTKNNNNKSIINKKNNNTIYKNNSNHNIKIKENNSIIKDNNLFKFSPNNTYIQKTINKSTPPENNYSKNDKNILYEDKDQDYNNYLFHRNSNTTLYNNYFTSESENNISTTKNKQKSFHVIKKTKRKVSNNSHNIYTNNYTKNSKNKITENKKNVVKYIKSIKKMNRCGNNNNYYSTGNKIEEGDKINQKIFGLKQIYKNSKYSLKKPINSLPMEIYIKTEENNKETPFKEISIIQKYSNKNENKNKTIEDGKKSSSKKKSTTIKRHINLGNKFIAFDKLNQKK